jgi:hypothetical protein
MITDVALRLPYLIVDRFLSSVLGQRIRVPRLAFGK